MPSWA